MAIVDEPTRIWEEIDRAESYLVCGMFDEATSLASSVLKGLLANCKRSDKGFEFSESFENDCDDMLESAGMVLVQSMKHSQRATEIVKELKLLFGSLTGIPVQVFLSGVCFEMSESPSTTVQAFLEEFLNSWKYVDDRYHPLSGAKSDKEGYSLMGSIRVDEYLAVVELYVITLLGRTVKNTNLAITWVEKAMLPMEKRQELLRRLQSMDSSTVTSSSRKSIPPELSDECNSNFLQEQRSYNGHPKNTEPNYTSKEEILKFSRQKVPCFWWFPAIKLKFGSTQLVIPTGKMMLASLLLLLYYLTRKKQALLKRFLAQKALSVKKALVDLWQLAFSYQVNPLAAVQSLPTTTSGNR